MFLQKLFGWPNQQSEKKDCKFSGLNNENGDTGENDKHALGDEYNSSYRNADVKSEFGEGSDAFYCCRNSEAGSINSCNKLNFDHTEQNDTFNRDETVKSPSVHKTTETNKRNLNLQLPRTLPIHNEQKQDNASSSSSLSFHLPTLYRLVNSKAYPDRGPKAYSSVREPEVKPSACEPNSKSKKQRRRGIYTETCPGERKDKNLEQVAEELVTPSEAVCLQFPKKSVREPPTRSASSLLRPVVYGELVVVGCDGVVPEHLRGKMKSKFQFRKRSTPNGLMEANRLGFEDARSSDIFRCSNKRSVCYSLHDSRSVVVEYVLDQGSDMFQIGRYERPPIDVRVLSLWHAQESRNGVSRFACRIVVQRFGKRTARIYASAFDASGNIFLGEGAVTCLREGKLDGFTTNGVLVRHPDPDRRRGSGSNAWREVSVCGYLYPLRSPQIEDRRRPRLHDETNVLQDGTLIDLCGVMLVWRTPEGLDTTPSLEYLLKFQDMLDELAPPCSVAGGGGVVPFAKPNHVKKEAYVYLSCGHVVGLLLYSPPDSFQGWSCPVCRCVCPVARLRVGMEPSLYLDRELPSHAFRPCGHVASLSTVRYWSTLQLPPVRNQQGNPCPFCRVRLNFVSQYVKLIFPKDSEFKR